MSDPNLSLTLLRQALADVRADASMNRLFIQTAREQTALFAELPPNFEKVWSELLDRLESSALFSEESCSFSQTDLLDSLAMVLDKVAQRMKSPQ